MDDELNQALADCLSGPKGKVVLDWIASQIRDTIPMTRGSVEAGTDSPQLHFLDGKASVFIELIERSGHQLTYERATPHERSDSYRDEPDGE